MELTTTYELTKELMKLPPNTPVYVGGTTGYMHIVENNGKKSVVFDDNENVLGEDTLVDGFYVSEWDDGIEIVSIAHINLNTKEVIIDEYFYDYDFEQMDLEFLNREYVKVLGEEYPCYRKSEAKDGDFWYK